MNKTTKPVGRKSAPSRRSSVASELPLRVGRKLANYREDLGLTQAQLAELVKVDTETISRFERGKYVPSLLMLEKLAACLRISISDLLADAEPKLDRDSRTVITWLGKLDAQDKAFALDVLKMCSSYLSSKRP